MTKLGHCKATAERIRKDAEQIATRLAKCEPGKIIAAEYGCNHITLRKHLIEIIGKERWRQLIYHRGPKPGSRCFGRPPGPKEENVVEDAGRKCFICRQSISRHTMVCPYCSANQWV